MPERRAKLFLSHASEDKDAIADALAEALSADFDVWYDKFRLTIGDSLLKKISEGLRGADFGVVILSKHFFEKQWPQDELDGLSALEETNRKVILPVWHDVSFDEVKDYSPILAGRLGINSSEGIPSIVSAIRAAVDAANRTSELDPSGSAKSRLKKLDGALADETRNKAILGTLDGVKLVRTAANHCANEVLRLVEETAADSEILKFKPGDGLNNETRRVISVRMPYGLTFSLDYSNSAINSAEGAHLSIGLYRIDRDGWGYESNRETLIQNHFYPRIERSNKISWIADGLELGEEQAPLHFLNLMITEVEKAYESSQEG